MKRFLALALTALLILTLVACGTPEDKGNTAAPDYFIEYKGVKVEVGVAAAPIVSAMGSYTSEDGEACGTDEKDVIYTFSGIELETHVTPESELIRRIRLLDDSVSTPEGIAIGSTRDEVIDAYGKEYTEGTGGAIRYSGAHSTIEFHFGNNGTVVNIYIRTK